jgi:lysophospholipase L1-like esterase
MAGTTILAFGDSLTWGSNPVPGEAPRHARTDRWPDMLAAGLGAGFAVIADGMRGRSTAYDEHLAEADRNGARLLPSALYTHAPLDLVILMLGTNDLKPHVAGSAVAALQGMRRCVEIVRNHSNRVPGHDAPARVLIVAPPPVVTTADPFYVEMFAGAAEQSRKLAGYYEALAAETGSSYFDAGKVAAASPIDGVHLDAVNSRAIGVALVPVVRAMFGI